jgi:hypothetical protein
MAYFFLAFCALALVVGRGWRTYWKVRGGKVSPGFFLRAWLVLWLPLVMICLVPLCGSYLLNVSETSIQELLLPLLLDVLVATVIALSFFPFFLRDRFRFYLSAIVLTYIVANGFQARLGGTLSTIGSLLPLDLAPQFLEVAYLGGLVAAICFGASVIDRQLSKRKWPVKELIGGIGVAVLIIFLTEFVPTVKDLAGAWPQFFYHPPALPAAHPTAAQLAAKPDIYYIVLEDYASQDVLRGQMDFDNSGFLSYLSGKGFTNLPGAVSNYPYTVNSVASTLDAGYLSDQVNRFSQSSNQTIVPYSQTVRESPVISQLKSLGYTYDLLGDWYETSNTSPLADHTYVSDHQIVFLDHTYSMDNFTDAQVQQNVLWNVIGPGISVGGYRLLGYNAQDDISMVKSQLAQLKTLAAQPAGGRFVFAQILAPHNSFYFNADGSLNPNPGPDNTGEPVDKKDTNEIQYINGQIQPIIDEIMRNSGGTADIILQSDEGPPVELLNNGQSSSASVDKDAEDMSKWPQAELQMKYGMLASYYVPAASAADLAAGADPTNIFRLVLNSDFNATLPYLPQCSYGFPQGESESFVYRDVTPLLTGQPSQGCAANGNFISPGPTKLMKVQGPPQDPGSSDDD